MHTLLSYTLKILNQIIQPYYCIFCFKKIALKSRYPICQECFQKKEYNLPPFCEKCGKSLLTTPHSNNICKNCLLTKNENNNFKSFYPFKYNGIIRESIHKLKYEGRLNLLDFLSSEMKNFAREYILPFERIDFISYVPLHPAKLKEREFNQAQLLAKKLSRSLEISFLKNLLLRKIYTKPQSELSASERIKNVRNVFQLNPKYTGLIRNSQILLIDDIITTGSTMRECIKEIKKYKATAISFTIAGG